MRSFTRRFPDRASVYLYILFTDVNVSLGGNININGTKTAVSIEGSNHFFVDVSVSAESASSNQGTTGSINFLLDTQQSDDIQGLGYGAGVYNIYTSGTNTDKNKKYFERQVIILKHHLEKLEQTLVCTLVQIV